MGRQLSLYSNWLNSQVKKIVSNLSKSVLVLFMAVFLSSCESSVMIVNDLEERDANEIIVFLIGHHIDAEKTAKASTGGANAEPLWNVAVKKSDRMQALTLLNNNGLPRRRSQNLLALFEKQGLVSSEMEERIRYQSGLAEQIAGTIRKIDGVLDADVQISFSQEESLPGQNKAPQPITASVYVKHQGVLDNPNSHLVLKIKRLVASAVPGLDFDRVTVVADRAIFNDPMSLALNKEPDVVSVLGIRVVHDYVLRLQMIFVTLVALLLLSTISFIWMVWKTSKILPQVGGLSSIFHFSAWEILPPKTESSEEVETNNTPAAEKPTPPEKETDA